MTNKTIIPQNDPQNDQESKKSFLPSYQDLENNSIYFGKYLLIPALFTAGSTLMLLKVVGKAGAMNKYMDMIINPKFFEIVKANPLMFQLAIAVFAVLISYYLGKLIHNLFSNIYLEVHQCDEFLIFYFQK